MSRWMIARGPAGLLVVAAATLVTAARRTAAVFAAFLAAFLRRRALLLGRRRLRGRRRAAAHEVDDRDRPGEVLVDGAPGDVLVARLGVHREEVAPPVERRAGREALGDAVVEGDGGVDAA